MIILCIRIHSYVGKGKSKLPPSFSYGHPNCEAKFQCTVVLRLEHASEPEDSVRIQIAGPFPGASDT